jgi:hypothetical protein
LPKGILVLSVQPLAVHVDFREQVWGSPRRAPTEYERLDNKFFNVRGPNVVPAVRQLQRPQRCRIGHYTGGSPCADCGATAGSVQSGHGTTSSNGGTSSTA